MDILYQEAAPEHARALLDYLNTVGGESDNLSFGASGFPVSVQQEEAFLLGLQQNSHSIMLLALDGEEIVGNGTIDGSAHPRFGHRCSLSVTVRKDHWGMGIGTNLMEQLIAFARDSGAQIISLEVRSDNARAIALYRKFGFQTYGVFRKFFRIGEAYFDADYMNLFL